MMWAFASAPPPSEIFDNDIAILVGPKSRYQDVINKFSSQDLPVLSQLDLALRYSKVPVIAITGTNGKSTVAKMTELMLEKSQKKVFLGGGPFRPYLHLITSKEKWEVSVLVVGSSELQMVQELRPQVSVLTNLVPSHYERHQSREEYFQVKAKVFLNQTSEETLIYNAENPYVVDLVDKAESHLFPFYLKNPKSYSTKIQEYAYYEKKRLYFCRAAKEPEIYSTESMKVKGEHQRANALCALSAARLFGANPKVVQEVLNDFSGLPHRMKKCFEKEGLNFFDDSRSSNPAATGWGLTAFKKPVVLIMGGLYMGARYSKLTRAIQRKVKLLILFGEARRKMFKAFKGLTETYQFNNLKEAVHVAVSKSEKGDSIVLSPGAPPDPQFFSGYKDLGNKYLEVLNEVFQMELTRKRLFDSIHPGGIKI